MISINSLVMAAWRARLYWRVNLSIMSLALLGSGIHGGHSCPVLGCNGLEERAVDFNLDVHREKTIEERILAWLVDEIAELVVRELQWLDGQERLDHHLLIDGALELVVDEVARIEVESRVVVDDVSADLACLFDAEILEDTEEIVTDVRVAAHEDSHGPCGR